jgi:hypothetical protein
MESCFDSAQHESSAKLATRHGLCNGCRVVPELEDRSSPFLIHAVLGTGSDGLILSGLVSARPGMTHWPDITVNTTSTA